MLPMKVESMSVRTFSESTSWSGHWRIPELKWRNQVLKWKKFRTWIPELGYYTKVLISLTACIIDAQKNIPILLKNLFESVKKIIFCHKPPAKRIAIYIVLARWDWGEIESDCRAATLPKDLPAFAVTSSLPGNIWFPVSRS